MAVEKLLNVIAAVRLPTYRSKSSSQRQVVRQYFNDGGGACYGLGDRYKNNTHRIIGSCALCIMQAMRLLMDTRRLSDGVSQGQTIVERCDDNHRHQIPVLQ